jgi:hypothetical protein
MSGHRLSRPRWTWLSGRLVTHGKDKIESGTVRSRELVPALAPQTLGREVEFVKKLKHHGVDVA